VDREPVHRHLAAAAVEHDAARAQDVVAQRPRAGPAQDRADAAAQLGRSERLGDVVVGAGLEAEDRVRLGVQRREHDDRDDVAPLAQRATDVVAVRPAAERDVEQHDVEARRRRAVDRRAPVGDRRDPVPLALEQTPDLLAQLGLVVGHEDVERVGHSAAPYRPAPFPTRPQHGARGPQRKRA